MKKLFILFIALSFLGCSLDDGGPSFSLEIRPILSVDIPEEFTFGETHEVSVTYVRPNGCYTFNNFIFQPDGNTRTVAVVDTFYLDENCTEVTEEATVSFNFSVISNDPYVFRFYQGVDTNGEDQYLIIEVPVAQ